MGCDPEAKLFYGYLQPEGDKETYNEHIMDDDPDFETKWSAIHTKRAFKCVGGMYGYSENLGFFLAVEASLYEAEWDEVILLTPEQLTIQPEWQKQLQQAATHFNLDVTELQPGWHLVCLYF